MMIQMFRLWWYKCEQIRQATPISDTANTSTVCRLRAGFCKKKLFSQQKWKQCEEESKNKPSANGCSIRRLKLQFIGSHQMEANFSHVCHSNLICLFCHLCSTSNNLNGWNHPVRDCDYLDIQILWIQLGRNGWPGSQ